MVISYYLSAFYQCFLLILGNDQVSCSNRKSTAHAFLWILAHQRLAQYRGRSNLQGAQDPCTRYGRNKPRHCYSPRTAGRPPFQRQTPLNNAERVFFIITGILGSFFYATVLGQMAVLVASMGIVGTRHRCGSK